MPIVSERNKLPIHHPEYLYPPSPNPYWTKLNELKGYAVSDNDTETQVGKWREQFLHGASSKRRELHVEIGCNTGHVVREWAARRPENDYVGIDWKFKTIHRGVEKAAAKGLKNMLFFRAHAERIQYMFGPSEIDHLYLYFPDPWPRKSQWKNRFLNVNHLRECARLVRAGGTFHIKTDHPGYFEWMEAAVSEVLDLWEITDRTCDLHAGHPNPRLLEIPDVTLFEKLFIKDGIKINSIRLQRK